MLTKVIGISIALTLTIAESKAHERQLTWKSPTCSPLEYYSIFESITKVYGPNAIRDFDMKIGDGLIVHENTVPLGYSTLMGHTLASLDGDEFNTAANAIASALGGNNLNQYKDTIRQIMRDEHARWTARGGGISLAVSSKKLVFKVFLTILFGIDDPSDVLRSDLEDFIDGTCRSMHIVPDLTVLPKRKKIVDMLISPALAKSRERVEAGKMKPCVLDSLVAMKSFSDDAIHIHTFDLLVEGVKEVTGAVVNSITAFCVNKEVHDKLVAARDIMGTKYATVDERWDHLDDLEYIQQYLREVVRFYGTRSAWSLGRAKKTISVKSDNGPTVNVKKGSLLSVALYAKGGDGSFNPERDVSTVSHFPATWYDDGLKSFILQSAFLSLLDFEWRMLPLQEYALDLSSNMPVGGLMAVNFRRRSNTSTTLFEVAGTQEDWTYLKLPDAKMFANSTESLVDLFTDSRIDMWTHGMLKLLEKKWNKWSTPHSKDAIKIPKFQKTLEKVTLVNTNIEIATEDEDWPEETWLEVQTVKTLRDASPMVDNFEDTWVPGEDMESYVLRKVGGMWPRVNVHWNDRYSDRAFELLVFGGLGQHLVRKLDTNSTNDGSYYVIELDFMRSLEVRQGFAKYGADAHFDKNGKVVKIVRDNKSYRPGDGDWEYVKMVFRGSLQTKVTAVEHLLGLHTTVGNYLAIASREQLPTDHPLRRLLTPFTFRAISINRAAARSLYYPKAALHRAYALSEKGMTQTWEYGLRHFKFETLPEQVARQKIDTMTIPFHQDGMDFWKITRNFISEYIDLYYKSEEAVKADKMVESFWSYLNKKMPGGMRMLTSENLKDFITQSVVWVTAYHNHLGSVAEYVSDPGFMPSAWVEGELAARPGNAVRVALVMSATGLSQPPFLEDFSHVMLDASAKAICQAYTASAKAFTKTIDARNRQRVQPYNSFNPDLMEISVGI